MAVGRERKPETSGYLPKNTKTGKFNPRRTLSVSFFVIPVRLESIRAVVWAFTASKLTNTLKYVELCVLCQCYHCICVLLLAIVHRIVYCIIVY